MFLLAFYLLAVLIGNMSLSQNVVRRFWLIWCAQLFWNLIIRKSSEMCGLLVTKSLTTMVRFRVNAVCQLQKEIILGVQFQWKECETHINKLLSKPIHKSEIDVVGRVQNITKFLVFSYEVGLWTSNNL